MASRRMIASDIFEDEFFCGLTFVERLLWIGLIAQCADDQGRLQDRPNTITLRIFPEDGLQPHEVIDGLKRFSFSKKIFRYSVDGKNIIQIVKWWNYQTPAWATPSKLPPPSNWTDRIKVHIPGNKVQTINWDKKGGFPDGYIDSVCTPIEDVNGEVNGNGNGEVEATQLPPPNAYAVYESNIGMLTPLIADGIDDWLKIYPENWIPEAIGEAVKNEARNFKYCDAILKRWAVEGFKSEKKKPPQKLTNIEANFALVNELTGGSNG